MLQLPGVYKPTVFGDEVVLRSIDWLENFPWLQDNTTKTCKDKYEIFLCVKDFTPEEISVKTSDGLVIVEGTHDERKDEHGFISRHFVRKYRMPEGCNLDRVQSRLTPDGVLVVSAPREIVLKQDTVIPVSRLDSKNKSKL